MFTLRVCFWDQCSLLLQCEIQEELVTCIVSCWGLVQLGSTKLYEEYNMWWCKISLKGDLFFKSVCQKNLHFEVFSLFIIFLDLDLLKFEWFKVVELLSAAYKNLSNKMIFHPLSITREFAFSFFLSYKFINFRQSFRIITQSMVILSDSGSPIELSASIK